mgnify:CR=1 FL=1
MTEHVQSQKGTISLVFYSPRKRATAPGVNQSKERNMSMSNGNSYSGTMRVTYYDHFGLDVNDMTGNYGYQSLGIQSLLGFHQWFILQHWNDLNADVQPKPFITTIEFEVPFSGSF